jgi:uncharacterized membrane protein YgdD (TMEM256/DUF423 family)
MKTAKWILLAGSLNAALAVMLGASGAHGLKAHLDEHALTTFKTAVDYHFIHALGLLIIGTIAQNLRSRGITTSAFLLLIGIVIFCGSLYLLTVTGLRWLVLRQLCIDGSAPTNAFRSRRRCEAMVVPCRAARTQSWRCCWFAPFGWAFKRSSAALFLTRKRTTLTCKNKTTSNRLMTH